MPRPKYVPTDKERETVRRMVLAGIPGQTIAECLCMSKRTLVTYYKKELEQTLSINRAELAGLAWQMALHDKNPQMTIFLCKTQLQWREKEHVIHEGEQRTTINLVSDGKPLRGLLAAERGKRASES